MVATAPQSVGAHEEAGDFVNVDFHKQTRRRDVFDALDAIEREHGAQLRRVARTPESMARQRQWIIDRTLSNPLVINLLRGASQDGRMPRNTEPWMALAEQKMWAGLVASDSSMDIDHEADESEGYVRTLVSTQLFMSQTYLWSKSVFDAIKVCPLPAHVIDRELLPFPFTFHSFEVAYGMVDSRSGSTAEVGETDWMQFSDSSAGGGFAVYTNVVTKEGQPPRICGSGIKYGTRFPDDLPEFSRQPTAVVLSLLAFLRSSYSEITQRTLPRQMKRHGELSKADVQSVINVVVLRRAAQDAVDAYNAETSHFRRRWWVSGHFRSQWFPSRKAHEVVWIAPYIKGPDGAPMIQKVYAVRR